MATSRGVLPVPGEIDRGHPAAAQHPLDVVPVGDGGGEIRRDDGRGHFLSPRTPDTMAPIPARRE